MSALENFRKTRAALRGALQTPESKKNDVPRWKDGTPRDPVLALEETLDLARAGLVDPAVFDSAYITVNREAISRLIQLRKERERAEAARSAASGEIPAPPPAPADATDEQLLDLFRSGKLRMSEYRAFQERIERALRAAAIDERIAGLEQQKASIK